MERRLQILEDEMPRIRGDLSDLKASVGRIEGKIGDMPTKDWLNTRLLAYLGALAAIVAIIEFIAS